MTGEMSSRTCYTKLNFDFPYVRSLSLRRDTYERSAHSLSYSVLRYSLIIWNYLTSLIVNYLKCLCDTILSDYEMLAKSCLGATSRHVCECI